MASEPDPDQAHPEPRLDKGKHVIWPSDDRQDTAAGVGPSEPRRAKRRGVQYGQRRMRVTPDTIPPGVTVAEVSRVSAQLQDYLNSMWDEESGDLSDFEDDLFYETLDHLFQFEYPHVPWLAALHIAAQFMPLMYRHLRRQYAITVPQVYEFMREGLPEDPLPQGSEEPGPAPEPARLTRQWAYSPAKLGSSSGLQSIDENKRLDTGDLPTRRVEGLRPGDPASTAGVRFCSARRAVDEMFDEDEEEIVVEHQEHIEPPPPYDVATDEDCSVVMVPTGRGSGHIRVSVDEILDAWDSDSDTDRTEGTISRWMDLDRSVAITDSQLDFLDLSRPIGGVAGHRVPQELDAGRRWSLPEDDDLVDEIHTRVEDFRRFHTVFDAQARPHRFPVRGEVVSKCLHV